MKRFEYLPLGKKAQTDIVKKQYQKLDDTYDFDKIIKNEKPTFQKCNRSNLIYDNKYSFYAFEIIKDFNSFSLKSKYGCNKRTQNFFDRPKDIDKNLKHEMKFIIKSNESIAENKVKKEIE